MAEVKKSDEYTRGYLDGLKAMSWQCGDCGNTYDNSVDRCPNVMLDQAYVNVRGVN